MMTNSYKRLSRMPFAIFTCTSASSFTALTGAALVRSRFDIDAVHTHWDFLCSHGVFPENDWEA